MIRLAEGLTIEIHVLLDGIVWTRRAALAVYALASARRIPVHRDGSALIARRSELDRWLLQGGGLRT